MKNYLLLGTIVKPQGLKGEVKLYDETGDASRFLTLQAAWMKHGADYAPVRVLHARLSGADVYLTLEGVCDRDAAEALRGTQLYVDRAHARKLQKNEVFLVDLIGLNAVDTQGSAIGTLTDVLQPGGTDVLVFDTPEGPMMAPHLKKLVKRITKDRMVLDESVLAEVGVYENRRSDDLS
ncbi:MAG TPA: ribosome maturation factor RimM [Candidatus Limiplasma sp.]|nr:ribosome maturation factor RimM [Candidatus Limiplasma sp.]